MVLFLFVIWLLNLQVETGPTGHLALKFFGSIAAALLVTELFFILAPPHLQVKFTHEPAGYGSLASLGGQAVHRLPGRVRGDFDPAAGRSGRFDRARAPAAVRNRASISQPIVAEKIAS